MNRDEKLAALRWLDETRDVEAPQDTDAAPASIAAGASQVALPREFRLSWGGFRELVHRLELPSAGELVRVVAERGGPGPRTAEELTRELVQRGELTNYQAERLAAGAGEELVFGDFVLLELIGEGGMGQVFRARERRADRIVALKRLPPRAADSERALRRFRREGRTIRRLQHPHIVAAYGSGCVAGRPYLVMEYIPGRNLWSMVRERGPLPVAEALGYVRQAALGLAHAHAHGIIHRDIKPANLLVNPEGLLKILDLGLIRLLTDPEQAVSRDSLTTEGAVLGTIDYMPPEQAADTHAVDARADIYALGCTLHYLLTGRPPFGGGTLVERALAHREQPIPDLCALRPDAPRSLAATFRKLLAKDPAGRHSSMHHLLEDLEQENPGCR